MKIETHPFTPFLPKNAKILILGSFPPQPKRWSIDFYYPNYINDFWRIMGLIFHNDKNYFIIMEEKKFDKNKIINFCKKTGLAMFDSATKIKRLKDNASDKFLEVVQPTNIEHLLSQIPDCLAIVTTGQKSTEIVTTLTNSKEPKIGSFKEIKIGNKIYKHYRMPSSSRAYPLSIDKKANFYKEMFSNLKIIA